MKKKLLSVLALTMILWMDAQKKDSVKLEKIEEVVLTGQYTQQSINKSIYKVEVIDAQQIKNMAATNVADILNQSLNILITSDRNSGNSTASLLGLGGEYTKILIDNIPVVGDVGLGNNIDLTKLNINNVERIEVVRGSMGVDYGSNAVAGVINIITKKSTQKKLTLNASVQEETVGKEYNWYKKGEGRHIQTLNAGYNLNENWYIGANINHNDFQGFKGTQEGYKYFEQDGKRGYLWQPKDVLNIDGVIRYSKNKTSVFYKFGFVNEKLNFYSPIVSELYLGEGNRTYTSADRDYLTTRYVNQLNVQTKLGSINYTGDFSYQTQDRKYRDFTYDIPNRKVIGTKEAYQSYNKADVIYSRGVFSNFLDDKKIDFQLGYELDHTKGYAGFIAGDFAGNNVDRKIFNYANFISAEWNPTDWLSLRPGYRLALSDKFDTQHNYSLTVRGKIDDSSNVRLVAGSANRFPNFDELYTYFVDSNHDIRGNEDLKPEEGITISLNGDKKFTTSSGWNVQVGASATYMDLKNRIEVLQINQSPLQYKYININKFRSLLFEANFKLQKNQFSLAANASYYGIGKELFSGTLVSPDDFFYTFEGKLAANYTLPKTGTNVSLFYRHVGKLQMFVLDSQDIAHPFYYVGERGNFNMMDFVVSQPFFKNHFELSAGIKNIFDVSSVRDTTVAGTAHGTTDPNSNLFYGRSYFTRLTYNF